MAEHARRSLAGALGRQNEVDVLLKAFAVFEIVSSGYVLWLIASGEQLSPPVIASRPIVLVLLLFQLFGVIAGAALLISLPIGIRLSLVFQALQVLRFQSPTTYLGLESAFSFPLSYSIMPGTIKDLSGTGAAEMLSQARTVSVDLLSLFMFGYLWWGLKRPVISRRSSIESTDAA